MPIRVHRVKQLGDGSLEIMIRGSEVDAEYVSGRLIMEKGVTITEPEQKEGMLGFIYLGACGTKATPFTRERAIQMLQDDQHIEVVADAGSDSDSDNAD